MASDKRGNSRRRWIEKLRFKYRLVILNDETLEEKLSFRLSRLNVFIVLGSMAILLVFITTYIIAFTPLREYIPGYASVSNTKEIYRLRVKTDSLDEAMKNKDLYIINIKNIIEGKELVTELPSKQQTPVNYKNITAKKSKEDSMLRLEVENMDKYSLSEGEGEELKTYRSNISSFLFFTPLKGLITNNFDPATHHYGIDIVAQKNESVKATLDGTIIFSDWTLETGYTIGIQHQQNLISVYRHNASLLKKQGVYVRAGEPVAIFGGSGELSSGPHLHFELWYNGTPVNPKDYMAF
jgi:murein DD-endopeptidase MepM/ murein hydrolase activator NlpD